MTNAFRSTTLIKVEENEYIVNPKKRRKYRIKPTVKQIKALQLINQGESTRGALIKAGYSLALANKSTEFFKQPGVIKAVQSMKSFLENQGLTNIKMAQKIAEFVDASNPIITLAGPVKDKDGNIVRKPDYRTQIEGVKIWNEVLQRQTEGTGTKKRELTITEFITGGDKNS